MEHSDIEEKKTLTFKEASERSCETEETLKALIRTNKVTWGYYIPPTGGKDRGKWVLIRPAFENWLKGCVPEIQQHIHIYGKEGFETLRRVMITL